MPTISYLTAQQTAKRARLARSSIRSLQLALDIEDGCEHPHAPRKRFIPHYLLVGWVKPACGSRLGVRFGWDINWTDPLSYHNTPSQGPQIDRCSCC